MTMVICSMRLVNVVSKVMAHRDPHFVGISNYLRASSGHDLHLASNRDLQDASGHDVGVHER